MKWHLTYTVDGLEFVEVHDTKEQALKSARMMQGAGIGRNFHAQEKDEVICPRCKRNVSPWPLKRGDRCSPKSWGNCIRTFEGIRDASARDWQKVGKLAVSLMVP